MKLLQVTVLCLLSSVRSSEGNIDVGSSAIPVSTASMISSAKTSVSKSITTPPLNIVMTSIVGTSPKGTTNQETSQTSQLPTLSSLITTVKGKEATTNSVTMKELTTKSAAVTDLPLTNAVSTLQSFQHKPENQSSTNTTERPVSTPQPDASPSKTSILPSVSAIIPKTISPSQGTNNAIAASPPSASPSHSNIILPVVIALIVITLSVFALVGLYRLCRKSDPGTPENGNDQPQSDKESVKLLTVKTISHESETQWGILPRSEASSEVTYPAPLPAALYHSLGEALLLASAWPATLGCTPADSVALLGPGLPPHSQPHQSEEAADGKDHSNSCETVAGFFNVGARIEEDRLVEDLETQVSALHKEKTKTDSLMNPPDSWAVNMLNLQLLCSRNREKALWN